MEQNIEKKAKVFSSIISFTWLVYFFLFFTQAVIYHTFGYGDYKDIFEVVFAVLFCLILGIDLIKRSFNSKSYTIILAGFLIRVLFLFASRFNWFYVIHADADGLAFHNMAVKNLDLGYIEYFHGGWYTPFITLLYVFIGPMMMPVTCLNFASGMTIIYLLKKILQKIGITRKNMQIVLCIASFCYLFESLSVLIMRDVLLIFFIFVSAYYFVEWLRTGNLKNFLCSFIPIFIGMHFHSGILSFVVIYPIVFVLYSKKITSFKFTKKRIEILFIVAILVLISCYFILQHTYVEGKMKFALDSLTSGKKGLLWSTGTYRGGSAYLSSIRNLTNPLWLPLVLPITTVYLAFSPMPWNWRGLSDILAFAFDGAIYLYFFVAIFKRIKLIDNERKKLVIPLLVACIFLYITFGAGTFTAGTATRHRCKGFPVLLLCYGLCLADKRGKNIKLGDDKQ